MENKGQTVSYSLGIPGVVVGCLLALKFAGLTFMSYTDIFWYGLKVWLVCTAIVLVFMLIVSFIYTIGK
jgi:ABC-type uncharacterized transport system permease subunit